jgi:hypothetical protein
MMSLGLRGSAFLFGHSHTKICAVNTLCVCVCVRNIVSSKNESTIITIHNCGLFLFKEKLVLFDTIKLTGKGTSEASA